MPTFPNQSVGSGTTVANTLATTYTPPPGSFASSGDWTSGTSPALPANVIGLWINTAGDVKVDGGGVTGFTFKNVQVGYWAPFLSSSAALTKIYSSGTTAVIAGTLS